MMASNSRQDYAHANAYASAHGTRKPGFAGAPAAKGDCEDRILVKEFIQGLLLGFLAGFLVAYIILS